MYRALAADGYLSPWQVLDPGGRRVAQYSAGPGGLIPGRLMPGWSIPGRLVGLGRRRDPQRLVEMLAADTDVDVQHGHHRAGPGRARTHRPPTETSWVMTSEVTALAEANRPPTSDATMVLATEPVSMAMTTAPAIRAAMAAGQLHAAPEGLPDGGLLHHRHRRGQHPDQVGRNARNDHQHQPDANGHTEQITATPSSTGHRPASRSRDRAPAVPAEGLRAGVGGGHPGDDRAADGADQQARESRQQDPAGQRAAAEHLGDPQAVGVGLQRSRYRPADPAAQCPTAARCRSRPRRAAAGACAARRRRPRGSRRHRCGRSGIRPG